MASKLPFAIRIKPFGLYLFALFLIYLAGSYLGSFFLFLFFFLLFLPAGSLFYIFFIFTRIKYYQKFSTEHPVKGESVTYKLSLVNEQSLPIPYITVHFKPIHPFIKEITTDFSIYLGRYTRVEREYTIQCPFRGVYTVGLDRLTIEDFMHFFSITRRVWHRTFYVYPRIPYIKHFPYMLEGGTHKAHSAFSGTVPDSSLFSQLKNYSPGEPVRHIYWKKFACTGIPFLKCYETSAEPGIIIYIDMRRETEASVETYIIEDTSIEILVALVKFLFDQGIRTEIKAQGRTLFSFTGNSRGQFNDFYTSTAQLIFQKTISPVELYKSDMGNRIQPCPSLFVTHLIDADLFAFMEESIDAENSISVIYNHAGYKEQHETLRYFNRLRDRGAKLLVVKDPDSIVEDLGGSHA